MDNLTEPVYEAIRRLESDNLSDRRLYSTGTLTVALRVYFGIKTDNPGLERMIRDELSNGKIQCFEIVEGNLDSGAINSNRLVPNKTKRVYGLTNLSESF